MNAQELASILLVMRIIAVVLIGAVLYRQIQNIRTKRTDYPAVRMTVFILTLVLFFGQFLPILLDAVVVFGSSTLGRSRTPNALASGYAISNASKDVIIGSLLVFLHYRPSRMLVNKR